MSSIDRSNWEPSSEIGHLSPGKKNDDPPKVSRALIPKTNQSHSTLNIQKVLNDVSGKISNTSTLETGTISQDIFKRLIPQEVLKNRGSPEFWVGFDERLLDDLLEAFKKHEVLQIETLDGVIHKKIEFSSFFEEQLYVASHDLAKAKIIANAFEKFFGNSHLNNDQQNKIKNKLIKYIDFIGVKPDNILKILRGTKALNFLESDDWVNSIKPMFQQIKRDLNQHIKSTLDSNSPKDEEIIITTTSSGGAHISISKVLDEGLTTRGIPHTTVNHSDLLVDDALNRCLGIPRKDLFNKVCQQSDHMAYGKKLKLLDDYLGEFIPDIKADNFRAAVGDAQILVSTSHHASDVRAAAEKAARVCFQACDFGELPDKLEKIAKTVIKYDLKGILFFAPSQKTTLKIKKDAPHASIGTQKTSSMTKEDKNYQHFMRVYRYPVHDAFTKEMSQSELIGVKKHFNLRPEAKLWIMTMGSQGVGGILEKYIDQVLVGAIEDLKEGELEDIDLVVLCGANESMKKHMEKYVEKKMIELCEGEVEGLLEALQETIRLVALPKIDLAEVAALGKASNAFLSKPGGGTAAEAIIGRFPMIIHKEDKHYWEFGNIEELIEGGASLIEPGQNFYQLAKQQSKMKAPNPLDNPEECVDYALELLWRLEQARHSITKR